MGFVPKQIQEIIDQLQPITKQIAADKEAKNDLSVVLSAAAPLFAAAGRNQASPKSLTTVFNDVSRVMPFLNKTLQNGSVPKWDAMKLVPTFLSLVNSKDIEPTFKTPGAELTAIYDNLLQNKDVQNALERILNKPVGHDAFALLQADGKSYAVEKLSGSQIRFPLAAESYNRIKAKWDAAANQNKPQGPSGPAL